MKEHLTFLFVYEELMLVHEEMWLTKPMFSSFWKYFHKVLANKTSHNNQMLMNLFNERFAYCNRGWLPPWHQLVQCLKWVIHSHSSICKAGHDISMCASIHLAGQKQGMPPKVMFHGPIQSFLQQQKMQ